MNASRPTRLVLLLAALGLPAASTAHLAAAGEPDKKACLDAYMGTQKLRKEGKLIAARKQALVCGATSCGALQSDCTQWVVDIEKSTPSVVFGVVDGEGHDVTDVTVYVDGEKLLDKLDGKAVLLDPGSHKVRFARGGQSIEETVLAKEGEKNRNVSVKLKGATATPAATTTATAAPSGSSTSEPSDVPPAASTEKPKDEGSRPTPVASYVLAGIGVAGLIGFAAFAAAGNAKKGELDDRGCKPACPQADVDVAKRDYLLADISLGVAVVGISVATLLYFSRGAENTPPAASPSGTAVSFGFSPTPHGAAGAFRIRF